MLQTQVANAALVRLIWQVGSGTSMINVLGAQVTGATTITQATANALGTAIKGALNSGLYKSNLSLSTSLQSVGVRDIRQVNLAEFIDNGAAISGTSPADTLARQVALVVSLRTAHAGRGYRGRIYLGGFAEDAEDADGTASSVLVTNAATFIAAVQSAMSAQQLTLAVVGRNRLARTVVTTVTNPDGTTNVKTRTSPATPGHVDPVTSIQIRNDIWDSQRRRTSAGSASTRSLRPLVSIEV